MENPDAGGSSLSFSSLKGGNALKHGGNVMDMLNGKHGGNALKVGGSCSAKLFGGRRRKSASKSRNNRKSRANRRKSVKKGGKKH